ncbi:hypothetical protein JXL19_05345 [bacterium]|nr:hypothetical protein [bacterium]
MRHIRNLMLVIMIISISCLVIATTGNIAMASVSGVCSNCHTMHDSQNNANVGGTGQFPALLNDSCIGCHTTSGSDPFVNGTPYVKGSSFSNDNCLAGGYFTDGGDTSGHGNNSHTLGVNIPPAGYPTTPTFDYKGDDSGNSFSCAGATGCHGNETSINNDAQAIKGGHHNTSATYRMLYVGTIPVAGTGCTDYEEDLIKNAATDTSTSTYAHNIYSASTNDTSATISKLCGKCHGNFHAKSQTGLTSPFTRHPTDINIPLDWEIVDDTTGKPHATYYTDSDRKYNPLGFAGGTSEDAVGRATCLSCHRAHGSAENDILRFAYITQTAGGGATYGCLGCHSKQR